jgi:predicted signal transduction protein with EAL and GGDEF domain
MNEQLFASKICQVLDRATHVEPSIAERLRAARERALDMRRMEHAPALAWADNVLGSFGGSSGLWLRLVLPALLVVLSVVGIYTWQQNQRLAEIEEIDAELLTDDLPIDAYLDRGFEAWLKKRAAR